MRIAITGGTGFVGRHLANELASEGHDVVLVARNVDQRPGSHSALDLPNVTMRAASIADRDALKQAFEGCDAVAHCAGINREVGEQTYQAIHVEGTENVVRAAEHAGVSRLAIMSFLRARPSCGSPYHESKWAAEEIVRNSNLSWTVLKPGMVYGLGDHMIDHLSHALHTFPIYVGIGKRAVRPLSIDDLVAVLVASLMDERLENKTVPVVGPTALRFDDAVRIVAEATERSPLFVKAPLLFHRVLASIAEFSMKVPLVAHAQVRILDEGHEPTRAPDVLPGDLIPATAFDVEGVRKILPPPARFGCQDLRWAH